MRRNSAILHKVLWDGNYCEMLVVTGKTYLVALAPFTAWLQGDVTLVITEGGIRRKLQ
jgi:hypothetical protein